MFKKFVEKGGYKKKKEYSYSSEGFDYPNTEYDDDESEEDSSHSPNNAYSSSRTPSGLASEIYTSCSPYVHRCNVDIGGDARFKVHVWCESEDEYRVVRTIESEYYDEPIDITVHYV